MPLTFAQLIQPKTFDQFQQQVLSSLQGLGVIVGSQGGTSGVPVGTGSASLSGVPGTLAGVANNPYACVVKVVTSGELTAAQVQVSIDGGKTYAGSVTIPSTGIVEVTGTQGDTGVAITFAAGPVGSGTSFVLGDWYAFNLTVPSFPVTAWQSGSVPRVLAMTDAQALASLDQMKAAIAAGGIVAINPVTAQPYSTGPWLDITGQNKYGLTRNPAVAAQVTEILTDASSQGPFTIAAGALIFGAINGQLYRNVTGGTLTKGGTLSVIIQALTPGAASSAADNTITTLNTPLPGVTVNNPGPGSLTIAGADQETDLAYATRCANRWPTLSVGATTKASYEFLIAQSDPSITRSFAFADPTISGRVDAYIANATGPASGGAVANAQAYLDQRILLTSSFSALAAIANNVSYSGTVYYYSSKTNSGAVSAAVAAALTLLHANGPIGKDNTPTVFLYLDQIYAAIEDCFGVRNFTLATPAADVGLTLGQVAVFFANTLAFTGV